MAQGRNIHYALAWQTRWGAPAAAADPAWTFQSMEGDIGPVASRPLDSAQLIGLGGGEIDPIPGAVDVSHSWSLPLCARQAGLWLHGLMGSTTSAAAAGSRGGYLFAAQPAAGDTITVGTDVLTFVSGAASAGEIQIGATVLATVAAAATVVGALTSLDAEARGQLLVITHTTADATGDAVATLSSAPGRIQPIAATLKGGGFTRHVWSSEANTGRPTATVEVSYGDVTGAVKHRVIDSQMVRALSIAKARAGAAMFSADILGRTEASFAARQLDATPTELAPMRFSYAGGSIMADGVCLGALEDAAITLAVDLQAGQFSSCSVGGRGAGTIGEPAVGDTSAAFSLTGRFPSEVLHDAALATTPISITLTYVQPATGAMLWIDLPRVFLGAPTLRAQGRGVVLASFSGQAMIDRDSGRRYGATLWSPVTGWTA
jgi:hypothetical protein